MKRITGIVLVLAFGILRSAAAFSPPTDDEVRAAALDPAVLKPLLEGASVGEAGLVVAAALTTVQTLDINDETERERVALLSGYAFARYADRVEELARVLASGAPDEYLPVLAAAAAWLAQPPTENVVRVLLEGTESNEMRQTILGAWREPQQTLGDHLAGRIYQMGQETGLAPARRPTGRLPSSLPLGPPPRTEAETAPTAAAVPVPPPYQGQ